MEDGRWKMEVVHTRQRRKEGGHRNRYKCGTQRWSIDWCRVCAESSSLSVSQCHRVTYQHQESRRADDEPQGTMMSPKTKNKKNKEQKTKNNCTNVFQYTTIVKQCIGHANANCCVLLLKVHTCRVYSGSTSKDAPTKINNNFFYVKQRGLF